MSSSGRIQTNATGAAPAGTLSTLFFYSSVATHRCEISICAQALKNSGVNIFPNEDSHKYVTVQDKNAIAETRMYDQMGLTASAMAYSWSKWNAEKESDKIIVQAAPQLNDEPLTEVNQPPPFSSGRGMVLSHHSYYCMSSNIAHA